MPRAASASPRERRGALEDVPVEDQQRVGDERDLDRRHRQPRERDEQLEEREARDRVEEVGEEADRLVELRYCWATRAEANAITKPIADRDHGEFQVLESAGWSVSPRWSCTQPAAEAVVLGLAGGARAEVGDDGAWASG